MYLGDSGKLKTLVIVKISVHIGSRLVNTINVRRLDSSHTTGS